MIRIKSSESKYHAKKTIIDEISFDSHAEAKYYLYLKTLKKAGEITNIEFQPVFELQPGYWKCCKHVITDKVFMKVRKQICPFCGKKIPKTQAITYTADFRVTYADGRIEIIDVKGMVTRAFEKTRKEFEFKYPELTLKIVRKQR